MRVRLHVNVDHVATLRQARGTDYPDPVEAAVLCEHAGCDGITVHLREDRRHVQDRDVELLRRTVKTTLNLEMAATDEMVGIAVATEPDIVTLVPERREERTTEGGLDVAGQRDRLAAVEARLGDAGVHLSLFIDPDEAQVRASAELGVHAVELHTGDYCHARHPDDVMTELLRLADAARLAQQIAPKMRVAAGHGLTVRNVADLVERVPELVELNIGHALVSDAVYVGLPGAVKRFRDKIDEGVARRKR